jgi:dTDP-4-amino-4,6-dideoxygalactose transaminase
MNEILNFLPTQYDRDHLLSIKHNYLTEQFSDYKEILSKIETVILNNDFTLGREVDNFERSICDLIGTKSCIAVGSGTDAIRLSLLALGIKPGDEVITTPYTFHATVGAIATTGAKPVFVDCGEDFNISTPKIAEAITSKTRAIVPVHWAGRPVDPTSLKEISIANSIPVIEDACHAILAHRDNVNAGAIGKTGCFSLHPLKNLNAWGDGGFICTDDMELDTKLRLMRNHGLESRDSCALFGFNSRLDTIQAVVANHLLTKLPQLTNKRINNAHLLDSKLKGLDGIKIPVRTSKIHEVFHLYCFQAEKRDALVEFLIENQIDAKKHYPVAMHLQKAARYLGYKEGDFPVAERLAQNTISLPIHEFIVPEQINRMSDLIWRFYHG